MNVFFLPRLVSFATANAFSNAFAVHVSHLSLTESAAHGYNDPGFSTARYMAIRFRTTDTARGSIESLRHRTRRRAVILMVIILSALLGILYVTKILIATPPMTEFIVYQGDTVQDEVQTTPKVRDISGGKPPAAPPVAPIIAATTDIANPSFTMDVDMDTPAMSTSGFDSVGGNGLGDGMGEGSGRGGMGGKKVDSAFAGYFWDLKRTANGKPSAYENEISNEQVLEFESNFYNKGWNPDALVMYMRSKLQLYSTCFFMPNCKDNEAVHAYDPTGKQGLKKSRWLVVYRAKVKAPASGTFRFVGAADTVMAVRFDGRNVLACGLHNLRNATWNEPFEDKEKRATLIVGYEGIKEVWGVTDKELKDAESMKERKASPIVGFEVGDPVTVKAGEWYEMQVMISEIGGGEFGFCLLIDEESGEKKTDKDGNPIFQLFRTAFSAPNVESAYETILEENKVGDFPLLKEIPYDPDSRIWEAKPVDLSVKMK